jgi:hypothetical protein
MPILSTSKFLHILTAMNHSLVLQLLPPYWLTSRWAAETAGEGIPGVSVYLARKAFIVAVFQ